MADEVGFRFWGLRRAAIVVTGVLVIASIAASAQETLQQDDSATQHYLNRMLNFLWQKGRLAYEHVWPEMKFDWRIVVGTIIGFIGAAFGTVGGVGGGGFFVPMLTLIIGFDEKSSTAISKCMITGGAAATVFYNLRLRHPTLDLPIIDYDLALLVQPMLMLGISIGVSFNVIFANWMITVLLMIFFIGTSTKAFLKGVETWKKETILIKEVARLMQSNGSSSDDEVEYRPLASGPSSVLATKESKRTEVSIMENVYWKELLLLVAVWVIILALQIAKNYTTTCSAEYWVLNLLQIPVALGVSTYEAVNLYKGHRVIASMEELGTDWKVHRLFLYCGGGITAGIVGGLLGLGGGFILGPLFLELGIPPQVSSATATFAMTFSASMSVVEYYLLKRFPVPYALYFALVASLSALVGQHVVRKVISVLGRASIIVFILASTIFVSAISLGGVGIASMVEKIENKEYMGFENICTYDA
ncbi:sulfite exporter TauE/SafE family protein 3 [Pyrus x bretschneideri]|uniref:sulfite exporter TauE/SafE family protein 3 n=1 Tax=Pyrus x bretschneideri TaxID=225117 RepID=UPI00202EE850|nr:sulfite exporter TauE/SafE family protein 3 [Pyrus x bretschneideri]